MAKETVYEHVQGCETFTVTAAETKSINMVKKLAKRFPDDVVMLENKDGSVFAHFPESWMRIIPKKQVRISDTKKEELRERIADARSKR